MNPTQATPKAGVLEKIVVNLFTPLDIITYAAREATKKISFGRLGIYSMTEKNFAAFEMLPEGGNPLTCKVRAYERLLRLLQAEHVNARKIDSIARPYMLTPCGRIDVMLAMKRGLLNTAQYTELSRKYHVIWNAQK